MAEKKINGRLFRVEPMPASAAIALYANIMQAMGSAIHRLPQLLVAMTSEEEQRTVMADVLAVAAITDVIKAATPEGTRDLIRQIVEVAQIQRPSGAYDPVDFDGDFTGQLGDILPVAKFVLTEQFSDFFTVSGASGVLQGLMGALRNTK